MLDQEISTMSDCSKTVFEIDRDKVARFFYWFFLWFLLPKLGWKFAKEQANRLHYWIEFNTLRVDGGLWWLQRKAIPLVQITDIKLTQGPILRSFGIWSVYIQTAGQGTMCPEAQLFGLSDPESARDSLLDAIEKVAKHSESACAENLAK